MRHSRWFAVVLAALGLLLPGCATYNRVANVELTESVSLLPSVGTTERTDEDVLLFVAFSGGGTRAAAFSYGVLDELRNTRYARNGEMRRLLDEVDTISSVSGGSFTAAYYGLFGDQIFEDYEDVFLKKNVQKTLIHGLLNPANWFRLMGSGFDRTEMAIDYYDREIFRGKTFADMRSHPGPEIQINATDLSIGQRFTFNQVRFNLLCSNLAEFKVARAVAASSAVPVAFAPIVLENYDTCQIEEPVWLAEARKRIEEDPRLKELVKALESYTDKERRRYVHLVDGGISDNLGVRSAYDRVAVLGGAKGASQALLGKTPRTMAMIMVNAQTNPEQPMDLSSREPKTGEVVGAVSSTQLYRYNVESISLMRSSLNTWAAELSTPERPVTPYFIEIDFESIADPEIRLVFHNVATSLALPADEVDVLIEAGRRLLRNDPEFGRLMTNIRMLDQGDRIQTSGTAGTP
ncbi:patatin-like phospholipase family protein [Thiogranum longum]